ncbi:MAG: hypothetical protein AB7S75_12820 [Desulfococcaceae bacterium]
MPVKRKKNTSFNIMVRKFMRDHNIPTKKDVEKLTARLERLEKVLLSIAEENQSKKKTGDSHSGAAAEAVMEIIREYENGVGFAEILQRSGFEQKKLRNLIFRLKKTGKIECPARGIYAVKGK